jgi:hypothetical protein
MDTQTHVEDKNFSMSMTIHTHGDGSWERIGQKETFKRKLCLIKVVDSNVLGTYLRNKVCIVNSIILYMFAPRRDRQTGRVDRPY